LVVKAGHVDRYQFRLQQGIPGTHIDPHSALRARIRTDG
jgi:hypothetical protein